MTSYFVRREANPDWPVVIARDAYFNIDESRVQVGTEESVTPADVVFSFLKVNWDGLAMFGTTQEGACDLWSGSVFTATDETICGWDQSWAFGSYNPGVVITETRVYGTRLKSQSVYPTHLVTGSPEERRLLERAENQRRMAHFARDVGPQILGSTGRFYNALVNGEFETPILTQVQLSEQWVDGAPIDRMRELRAPVTYAIDYKLSSRPRLKIRMGSNDTPSDISELLQREMPTIRAPGLAGIRPMDIQTRCLST